MLHLGIDIGTSTVKLALINASDVCAVWENAHKNNISQTISDGLNNIITQCTQSIPSFNEQMELSVGLTGADALSLHTALDGSAFTETVPAIVEGVKLIAPDAGSIIEIGSQGSRFITNLDTVPQFATNGHCAGGTGSFFEDQMSRLGLSIEDYSSYTNKASSIPRLSGRCAVFAKTDIIHRQQEGVSTPDILLGLCYAMIKNYKATIVKTLPVVKPVVFCGGVTKNNGVTSAIKDVFALHDNELIIPENAVYAGALGAALHASGAFMINDIISACKKTIHINKNHLEKLNLSDNTSTSYPVTEPDAASIIQSGKCSLGIDIGSTSTDLVIISEDGKLLDYQYLRTAGNPEKAVEDGFNNIYDRFGKVTFSSIGVTGSGRERIGKKIGADAIRDEITAQAAGAVHCVPDADTVFEIGGQDSKYISINDKHVVDFQMNKICAAGTGSFVEEQSIRMGIPIEDFGHLALTSDSPVDLGERCTVFIETAIASATAEGIPSQDIAAGLCYSIIRNYLHKVVGSKHVGNRIVLQGGVVYNPGIVAAFQHFYGDRLTVNPYFAISGAFGVALLARDAIAQKSITDEEIRKNIEFYKQADKLLLDGYTGKRDAGKKTVGVPYVLMIHKFFPMANAFFTSLGFNVILTQPTNEETIKLSQEYARGETCYPVKLIYGHMKQLIDQNVDYIFLPTIHTMKHEKSHVEHNYGCVYMQTAAESIGHAMNLKENGITMLSPVFDLDFGKEAMASSMLGLGKILGIPKPLCAKALLSGAIAVRKHTAAVEKQGKILLDSLKPDDKVLVLITRNYGVSDPVLNMGIPELLLERGHKIITLSHLPGHDLDISDDYHNLYWPFGQHIISGAKLIANHPNLYAVYLTNHGCGPDSMISHLFRQEMGDKPYLQIEVDEHYSKVGVITRIEAFLNSLSSRQTVTLPDNFNIKNVTISHADISTKADNNIPVYIPDLGYYTDFIRRYLAMNGLNVYSDAIMDDKINLGRSHTNSKEYLPFVALLGNVLDKAGDNPVQYLIPQNQGSDADGEYARTICSILTNSHISNIKLVSPMLEQLPQTSYDYDCMIRSIMAGDIVYAAPANRRKDVMDMLSGTQVPCWNTLLNCADTISTYTACNEATNLSDTDNKNHGLVINAVGTPMCLTSLNDGILDTLDNEGNICLRAPLSESLYFLWKDNNADTDKLSILHKKMCEIGKALGKRSSFATDADKLFDIADTYLPHFAGANGRYRYAKAVDMSVNNELNGLLKADAILTFAPRYENTAIILNMRELDHACQTPLYNIELDHDWDESSWSKLKSFLYYCR